MKKAALVSLGAIVVIMIAGPAAFAGSIAPEVESAMEAAGSGEKVSVIVRLVDQTDLTPFKTLPGKLHRTEMIKKLRSHADSSQRPLKDFLLNRGAERMTSLWLINGMTLTASPEVIRELAAFPQVAEIQPDKVIPCYVPTVGTLQTAEWNIDAIHARDLWALGFSGRGVVVANMDTGVDVNHPDLKTRWRGGANSWFDPYRNTTTPYDPDGHGTGTMGAMVGGSASGTAIGVAPEAKWIGVKIFSDGRSATYSAIHAGFQWILDPDGNPNTDDAPDVVNNSWGSSSPTCSRDFEADIQALSNAGIAVVFAAGNSGPGTSTACDPANNPGVFSVGAIDNSSLIAYFSSRGPSQCDGSLFPRVVAPGLNIKLAAPTTTGGPLYQVESGTSFSSPHASGAMALLLSAFPGLTVDELEQALISSATNLGATGADNTYGNGLINVMNAYAFLQSLTNTVTLGSRAVYDGWTRETSPGSAVGGTMDSAGDLLVGDDTGNLQYKSVLSFNTGSIPVNAVVTSAKLTLTRKQRTGTSPFTVLGSCNVDVKSGTFNTTSLAANDFQAPATAANVATMSNPITDGAHSHGLFDENGLRAINKGGLTQLRLYFSQPANGNSLQNMMTFWSGDAALAAQRPKLKLTYIIP